MTSYQGVLQATTNTINNQPSEYFAKIYSMHAVRLYNGLKAYWFDSSCCFFFFATLTVAVMRSFLHHKFSLLNFRFWCSGHCVDSLSIVAHKLPLKISKCPTLLIIKRIFQFQPFYITQIIYVNRLREIQQKIFRTTNKSFIIIFERFSIFVIFLVGFWLWPRVLRIIKLQKILYIVYFLWIVFFFRFFFSRFFAEYCNVMHNIQGFIRFRFVILRGNILDMNSSNINSRLQMMISATKEREKKTLNEYVRLWVPFEQHHAM